MTTAIPLTKQQAELIKEFYALPLRRVLLSKEKRNLLWAAFKKTRTIPAELQLEQTCPALAAELKKALFSGNHVQSAVFSECVYAQALANHLQLNEFAIYESYRARLPYTTVELIASHNIVPRYVYYNHDNSRILVQAGGMAE